MPDWTIDCSTFLQLTGAELGEYGEYWIDEQGIRSFLDNSPENLRLLASHEAAWRLAFDRDARLSFPVASERLIQWCRSHGGEFVLPDWFEEAAECKSVKRTRSILVSAKAILQGQLIHAKEKASSARARLEEVASTAEVLGELDAIEHLLCTMSDSTGVVPRQQRFDALAHDIEAALRNLPENATPNDVVRFLISQAGQPGWAVISVDSNGEFVWIRDNGEEDKTAQDAVRRRVRIRQKAGSPKAR